MKSTPQDLGFREAEWDFRGQDPKSDSDVEVVGEMEAPSTPAQSQAASQEHVSVLLELVKVKMAQCGGKSHAPPFVRFFLSSLILCFPIPKAVAPKTSSIAFSVGSEALW